MLSLRSVVMQAKFKCLNVSLSWEAKLMPEGSNSAVWIKSCSATIVLKASV